jgi:hypothetical protein
MSEQTKVPARVVSSDDCVIYIGRVVDTSGDTPKVVEEGEAYYPHKGETVEIAAVKSIRQSIDLAMSYDALFGAQEASATFAAVEKFCETLAPHVRSWTWTDNDGSKMEQPSKETLLSLSDDEVAWLYKAVRGETAAQRKNG